MSKSAMTEQITGTGAKRDCDDVDIRRDGTHHPKGQQAARKCALGKRSQEGRGRYAMGKDGGHWPNVTQSVTA